MSFIRAEREDRPNLILHLDSVVSLLPYFHAAGHILSAKSAHLYAQDMCIGWKAYFLLGFMQISQQRVFSPMVEVIVSGPVLDNQPYDINLTGY